MDHIRCFLVHLRIKNYFYFFFCMLYFLPFPDSRKVCVFTVSIIGKHPSSSPLWTPWTASRHIRGTWQSSPATEMLKKLHPYKLIAVRFSLANSARVGRCKTLSQPFTSGFLLLVEEPLIPNKLLGKLICSSFSLKERNRTATLS